MRLQDEGRAAAQYAVEQLFGPCILAFHKRRAYLNGFDDAPSDFACEADGHVRERQIALIGRQRAGSGVCKFARTGRYLR